jgi:hypothetical protein
MAISPEVIKAQGLENFTPAQLAELERLIKLGGNSAASEYVKQIKLAQRETDQQVRRASDTATGNGMLQSALQGLSFGWADEIQAAMDAPFSRREGESIPEAYRRRQQEIDLWQRQYAKENPWKAFAGEAAGSLVPGFGGLKAVQHTMKGATPAAQLMTTGAIEGGVYGAGQADPGKMTTGGLIGATTGAASAPVGAKVGDWLGDKVGGLFQWGAKKLADTPERQADRYLQKVAREYDQMTPEEITARLQELGPEATLADVSPNMQGAARAAAAEPGPARTMAVDTLKGRQPGQQTRIMQATSRELGGLLGDDPTDLRAAQEAVKRARSEQAAPYYAEAYDTPFMPTGELADILNTDSGRKAYNQAIKKARDERVNLQPDKMIRALDYTKRSLDDMIGKAQRSNQPDKVRVLTSLKKDLVAELDAQAPAYATARSIYAKGYDLEKAGDAGENIFSMKPDEAEDIISVMKDSERVMYKLGVIKAVRDKVELAGESHNAVKRLINSTGNKRKLRTAFDSDESFDEFMRVLNAENDMRETMDKVLHGSHTARIQQELADMNKGVNIDGLLATQDPTLAASYALKKLVEADKVTPETLEAIGKRLFTQGLREEEIIDLFTRSGVDVGEGVKSLIQRLGSIAGHSVVPVGGAAVTPLQETTGLLQ